MISKDGLLVKVTLHLLIVEKIKNTFKLKPRLILKFKSPNNDLIMQFMAEIETREKLETNLKTSLKISSKS